MPHHPHAPVSSHAPLHVHAPTPHTLARLVTHACLSLCVRARVVCAVLSIYVWCAQNTWEVRALNTRTVDSLSAATAAATAAQHTSISRYPRTPKLRDDRWRGRRRWACWCGASGASRQRHQPPHLFALTHVRGPGPCSRRTPRRWRGTPQRHPSLRLLCTVGGIKGWWAVRLSTHSTMTMVVHTIHTPRQVQAHKVVECVGGVWGR